MGLAKRLPVDPALPAGYALSTLAGGLQGKAVVDLAGDHLEPLPVWTCTALPPGSGKSPTLNPLRRPVLALEGNAIRTHNREEAERVRQLDEVVSALKAKNPPDKSDLVERKRELERQQHPRPTWLSDDATPEALAKLAEENAGRMCVLDDEGTVFDQMTGLYAKDGRSNLAFYLKGHDGGNVRINRVSRPPTHIPAAYLTLGLAVQPLVLNEARDHKELGGRGILQRLLLSAPPNTYAAPESVAGPHDPALQPQWDALVSVLWGLPRNDEPRKIAVTTEARKILSGYHKDLKHRMAYGDLNEPPVLHDWASKAAGTAARIACIFAAVGHVADLSQWRVEEADVTAAIQVMEYYAAHARFVFSSPAFSAQDRLRGKLVRWLERNPDRWTFRSQEAHNAVSAPGVTAAEVEGALATLVEAHYLRRGPPHLPRRGGGRPPSKTYVVNPRWQRG